jgi:tetratricopeptide (TPR) repeat protein
MYCIVLLTCVQLGYAQDFIGKAKISLGTRDTTLAIKNFEEALKAGQKTAECNYYLGAIAFARNKTDDAISYLQASLKGNDENVEALKVLGDAYMLKKNTEEALTQYRKAERLAKKNPAVLTAYGEALLAADSTDAAIRMLVLAKEYDATDPAIFRGLGDAYLKQNVLPLAISQYQKAVELDPKNISTRFALARLFAKGRQYNDAVREYDGVITIDSTYADAYFAKGNILLLAKQYKNAIPPLRKCVMLRPKSAEGATLLAKALFGAHDYPEAAQAAERALALDSTNVDIWRISAYSLVEMKDFRTALGAFGALQRRKAFKPEDQTKYGAALFGLGKEDEALNSLLAAVQLDSANCDPYSSLGSIYMNKRDYEKAAAMFEKKIACEPGKLSAYLNGAACYMQLKAFPRVRQLLTHVLDVEPELLLGRFMLARYFTQVDSLSMAKEQYDEVLKVAATNPEKYKKEMGEAHGQTGQYYFIMRQYERAIESFKRTVPLGYDNPSLHLMWGQSLLQLLDPKGDQAENKKKIDEAVRQFRRTIELEPNSEQGHLWLAQGLVFSRVEGDNAGNQRLKDEACGEYRKVLKVNPRNEDAKKGIERIGCPGVGK